MITLPNAIKISSEILISIAFILHISLRGINFLKILSIPSRKIACLSCQVRVTLTKLYRRFKYKLLVRILTHFGFPKAYFNLMLQKYSQTASLPDIQPSLKIILTIWALFFLSLVFFLPFPPFSLSFHYLLHRVSSNYHYGTFKKKDEIVKTSFNVYSWYIVYTAL